MADSSSPSKTFVCMYCVPIFTLWCYTLRSCKWSGEHSSRELLWQLRPRCEGKEMAGRSFVPIFQGCRSLGAFRRTCRHALQKRLLSNGTIPPLNEPLPNMPAPPPDMVGGADWQNRHDHVTHVTELENGIRVASEDSFGQFSTVGGKFWICQVRTD